jgi:dipeptidyl aminopeptidase/acylaminoacyl peptidase
LRPERPPSPGLAYTPLEVGAVRVEEEARTVEESILLDLYSWLHHDRYSAYRVEFPAASGEAGVAHWLIPDGDGAHATVIVFPILAGSHVVSEGFAKALVNRGYAVLRMEREALELETAEDPEALSVAFRGAIADARRLLDWLETRAEVDPSRLAAAGVSLGGIMAATLVGADDRLDAGIFVMTGGGLAEMVYESTEKPVRKFRDRIMESQGLETRAEFVEWLRPLTEPVDPLRYASRIDPERVLLISGRFDRVVPPERTRALWEELGEPRWIRVPAGHYQFFPFFWWAAGRGADHLDRVFAPLAPGPGT